MPRYFPDGEQYEDMLGGLGQTPLVPERALRRAERARPEKAARIIGREMKRLRRDLAPAEVRGIIQAMSQLQALVPARAAQMEAAIAELSATDPRLRLDTLRNVPKGVSAVSKSLSRITATIEARAEAPNITGTLISHAERINRSVSGAFNTALRFLQNASRRRSLAGLEQGAFEIEPLPYIIGPGVAPPTEAGEGEAVAAQPVAASESIAPSTVLTPTISPLIAPMLPPLVQGTAPSQFVSTVLAPTSPSGAEPPLEEAPAAATFGGGASLAVLIGIGILLLLLLSRGK